MGIGGMNPVSGSNLNLSNAIQINNPLGSSTADPDTKILLVNNYKHSM
jgi:hypothetical protein